MAEAQQALYLLSENTLIFICDDDAAHVKGCKCIMRCLLIIVFALWFNYLSDSLVLLIYILLEGFQFE